VNAVPEDQPLSSSADGLHSLRLTFRQAQRRAGQPPGSCGRRTGDDAAVIVEGTMRSRRRLLAWTLTGAAALMLGGVAIPSPARAAYPGHEGLIALVRNGNIYTVNPDGSGLRRLTFDGGNSGPRWSPDGRHIAFIHRGDVWVMRANGIGKTRLTHGAPKVTDSRPSWSPDGRYLAFVARNRGTSYGYLTRYDTATHQLTRFSTDPPQSLQVTALPAAVAWTRNDQGYWLLYNGTGKQCMAGYYCLNLLGMQTESATHGYPSLEQGTKVPQRWLDPDWYPVNPVYYDGLIATVESCTASQCTHIGIDSPASPPKPVILPHAYQAVFSPTGTRLAFVRDTYGTPEIYLAHDNASGPPDHIRRVSTGNEPDWQPVPA
jgi:hypothetical protein